MKLINSIFLLLVFQLSFSQEKIKIDGISSVVGDFIILDSDIDKVLIDMESQEFQLEVSQNVNCLEN